MDVVVDASAIIAVVLDEPEKAAIVAATEGAQLIAPPSLHWEVGNALAAMFRRHRISLSEAEAALDAYQQIVIRPVDVDLRESLRLAHRFTTYAYDAYILACALRYGSPLLSLDAKLKTVATAAGVEVLEIGI